MGNRGIHIKIYLQKKDHYAGEKKYFSVCESTDGLNFEFDTPEEFKEIIDLSRGSVERKNIDHYLHFSSGIVLLMKTDGSEVVLNELNMEDHLAQFIKIF